MNIFATLQLVDTTFGTNDQVVRALHNKPSNPFTEIDRIVEPELDSKNETVQKQAIYGYYEDPDCGLPDVVCFEVDRKQYYVEFEFADFPYSEGYVCSRDHRMNKEMNTTIGLEICGKLFSEVNDSKGKTLIHEYSLGDNSRYRENFMISSHANNMEIYSNHKTKNSVQDVSVVIKEFEGVTFEDFNEPKIYTANCAEQKESWNWEVLETIIGKNLTSQQKSLLKVEVKQAITTHVEENKKFNFSNCPE